MSASRALLRELFDSGRLELDLPGRGSTARRHRQLLDLAASHPVSVARLAEAHVDAMAILAEAGSLPRPGALYGVWASAGADEVRLSADRSSISGTKPFCSGLGIVDRALITVVDHDGLPWLVDSPATPGSRHVTIDTSGWSTPALAETKTGSIRFAGQPVDDDAVVGGAGFYLDRVGFWHGACGPAACWAGAAIGLVSSAEALIDDDPHRRAHLGALRSIEWSIRAVLTQAGQEIDEFTDDRAAARWRAQSVRRTVERACTDLLDHFARAFGPRPASTDAAVAQRIADTQLYVRQYHAERDDEQLGRMDAPAGDAVAQPTGIQ